MNSVQSLGLGLFKKKIASQKDFFLRKPHYTFDNCIV